MEALFHRHHVQFGVERVSGDRLEAPSDAVSCLPLDGRERLNLLVVAEHLSVDTGYVPDWGRVQGLRDDKAFIQDPLLKQREAPLGTPHGAQGLNAFGAFLVDLRDMCWSRTTPSRRADRLGVCLFVCFIPYSVLAPCRPCRRAEDAVTPLPCR